MARFKQIVTRAALLALLPLGLLAGPPAQAHHAPSLPAINVQPPFSGAWDRFGLTHPTDTTHALIWGDWSVDAYRQPGSTVRVRAYPVSRQGAVAYRIAAKQRACKTNNYADGGDAVKVEFHYGGHYVGFAWYLHLANVQVAVGQWVPHAAVLGYTAAFNYGAWSDCYQVTGDDGVHVHFELYSNRHYACYIPRARNHWMQYYYRIGIIGGDYAHTKRAAC